jgi:hypothetical protein
MERGTMRKLSIVSLTQGMTNQVSFPTYLQGGQKDPLLTW